MNSASSSRVSYLPILSYLMVHGKRQPLVSLGDVPECAHSSPHFENGSPEPAPEVRGGGGVTGQLVPEGGDEALHGVAHEEELGVGAELVTQHRGLVRREGEGRRRHEAPQTAPTGGSRRWRAELEPLVRPEPKPPEPCPTKPARPHFSSSSSTSSTWHYPCFLLRVPLSFDQQVEERREGGTGRGSIG
ncbi:hypothetical protein E2C01_033415 [Portunus trituberculatus]|uniref:Uncharacterized protein n=1 Tax=Portunus trituberculatus TaxID=210409 RepID=A0A5B7F5G4_PORTR|nr:hypothetical protein [Portunus trituberculatus]